jgi:GNAT superfamily N-acetyltransferase
VNDSNNVIVGAFEQYKLIGLGVAQIITNFEWYLPFDPNITMELAQKKVASFSTLAVNEAYQGKGIGQEISRMRLAWVKDHKCEVILGVSWVSGLSHTSDRVFEKMGFKAIKKLDNFFVELSLKNPFDCPGCKNAPCTCAAILYRRDLS